MAHTAAAAAFAELQRTFESNRTLSLEWRMGQLQALHAGIRASHEQICRAAFEDLHRSQVETLQADVLAVLAECAYAMENLEDWLKPVPAENAMMMAEDTTCEHAFRPKGMVLIIAPFNVPFNLAFTPLIGAICAGDCAIVKPSEMAPHCATVIEHIITKYLDNTAFKVVQGAVEETSDLLELPFDHFFYTGNGTVGRIVMQAAAKHLSTVTLELGGKSPVYVHEDANLGVAARRLVEAKLRNGGQICVAPDYVMVHHAVFDAFVLETKQAIEKMYPRPEQDLARVVNGRHFARVMGLVQEQPKDKVVVVGGGGDVSSSSSALYIPPTLILRPALDSQVMQQEVFGPVLPILPVAGVHEALRVVSKVGPKPLAAYVFTETNKVADEFISQVQSGAACVNAVAAHLTSPHLAFGGSGPSGIGRYRGRFSFEDFSLRQAVVRLTTHAEQTRGYPPFGDKMLRGLKSML